MCLRMKQRLRPFVSSGRRRALAETNVVSLKLSIQSGAANAEHLSGARFIALDLLEHALNCVALQFFKVGIGSTRRNLAGNYAARSGILPSLLLPNRRRQIRDIDRLPAAESHCAFNAVFQLAHVAWPVILQHDLHGCGRNCNGLARSKTVKE